MQLRNGEIYIFLNVTFSHQTTQSIINNPSGILAMKAIKQQKTISFHEYAIND